MPHFSFDTTGAKEKFTKENAERKISPSAEGAKGYSPLTSQAFEKSKRTSALTKTFRYFDSANAFVSKLTKLFIKGFARIFNYYFRKD